MTSGTKLAGKTAALGKSALKALEGYPGIFHHLAGEHAEVAALMKRVAGSDDPKLRNELFAEIRKNLLAHAEGEEEVFYPAVRRLGEMEALVARCLAEHETVKQHLERLHAGDGSTSAWTREFEQMMQAVEAHVEREENELFPQARDLLEKEDAGRIADLYEQVEERVKARVSGA